MAFVVGQLAAPLSIDLGPFTAGLATGKRIGAQAAKSISKDFESLSPKFKKLGEGLSKAITAPLVGISFVALAVGRNFDEAFGKIRSQTGATGGALEALKNDFREVFRGTPESAEKVASALALVHKRLGLTGPPLQQVTANFLDLADLLGADLNRTIESGTRLFGDWSVATSDQARTLDKVYRAAQSTGSSVETLMERVVQFGAPLRNLGFDLETSVGLLAKWEKEGVNVETVLSGLRFALGFFGREGKNAQRGFRETVAEIQRLGRGADATALAFKVFGQRAGNDMVAAIVEGRFALGELEQQIRSGKDTIESADQEAKTFAERMAELGHEAALAAEPLGTALVAGLTRCLPAFKAIIGFAGEGVRLFSALPGPIKDTAAALVVLTAAAGPLLILTPRIVAAGAAGLAAASQLTQLSLVGPLLGANLSAAAGAAGVLTGALVGLAGAGGVVVGLGLNKLLDDVGLSVDKLFDRVFGLNPKGMEVFALLGDEERFQRAVKQFEVLRKSLGLTADQYEVTSERTRENVENLVRFTDELLALSRARIEAARAARDQASADKEAAASVSAEEQERLAAVRKIIDGLHEDLRELQESQSQAVARELKAAGATQREIAEGVAVVRQTTLEKAKQTLKEQLDELQLSKRALLERKLAQEGATKTEIAHVVAIFDSVQKLEASAEAAKKDAAAQKERQEAIRGVIGAVEQRLEGLRQTGEDLLRSQLGAQGATQVEVDYALRVLRTAEALEKKQAIEEEARQIVEQYMTSQERLNAELARAEELWRAGALSTEQYQRILERTKDTAVLAAGTIREFAINAAMDARSAFAQFLFDPFEDGLKGMVKGFADALRRMLAEWAAAKLFEQVAKLFDLIGGAVAGGGATASVSSLGASAAANAAAGAAVGAFFSTPGVSLSAGGGLAGAGAGGGVQVFYSIDARGAAPGVEQQIMRALEAREPQVIARAVRAVEQERLRGGSMRESFRR